MARIRSVHPELCTDEKMAELPAEVERTFVRLWTHCDDQGRCVDNARLIKAAIYPLHDDMGAYIVDQHLTMLADAGCIVRYEVGERAYISIPSWHDWQHPQRPKESKLPPPPDTSATDTGDVRDEDATPRVPVHAGEGEGVGDGGEVGEGAHDAPAVGGRRSNATPLPPDFAVTDEMRQWAYGHKFTDAAINRETEKFREHAKSIDRRQRDWAASWRKWLLQAVDYAAKNGTNGLKQPGTGNLERAKRVAESLGAEL